MFSATQSLGLHAGLLLITGRRPPKKHTWVGVGVGVGWGRAHPLTWVWRECARVCGNLAGMREFVDAVCVGRYVGAQVAGSASAWVRGCFGICVGVWARG